MLVDAVFYFLISFFRFVSFTTRRFIIEFLIEIPLLGGHGELRRYLTDGVTSIDFHCYQMSSSSSQSWFGVDKPRVQFSSRRSVILVRFSYFFQVHPGKCQIVYQIKPPPLLHIWNLCLAWLPILKRENTGLWYLFCVSFRQFQLFSHFVCVWMPLTLAFSVSYITRPTSWA
jgi:hypothetical protein